MNMFLLKEPSRNHRVYRLLAGEFLINCATFYTATGGGGGYIVSDRGYSPDSHDVELHAMFYSIWKKKAYKGGRGLTCTPLATRLNRQRYNVKFALKPVAHSDGAYPHLRSRKRRQEVLPLPPPLGWDVIPSQVTPAHFVKCP